MALDKENSTILQVLKDFGNEMQKDMRDNLSNGGGLASGELSQSINFSAKVMGSQYSFTLTMIDYWEAVNEGRKAGKAPPITPILEWVNTKATFGGYTPPGKIPIRDIPNIKDRAVQRGLAYVIARKIGKKGTKGTHFFDKVVNENRMDKLRQDLYKAGADDFGSAIGDIFKQI